MKLLNRTKFSAFAFRQFDDEGLLDVVVSVRAYFQHRQNDIVGIEETDDGFQWVDTYEADPHLSPMIMQTDLVPSKPGTDVTFLGDSYPADPDARTWHCEIGIGSISKRLAVSGPRYWERMQDKKGHGADWQLGDPTPASSVPLDWRLAGGGPIISGDTKDHFEDNIANPIGLGRPNASAEKRDYRGPQVLDVASEDPGQLAGVAPVPPFWPARSKFAGTYDAQWKEDRHPLLPRDFDPMFWQCAPADQIAIPYLRGDETYALENVHPKHSRAEGRLPGINLAVLCENNGEADWHILNLDGVHFDWRESDRISLTWRARFPLPDAGLAKLTLERVQLVDPETQSGEAAA